MKKHLAQSIAAVTGLLLSTAASQAAMTTYSVDITTAPLALAANSSDGPYYLDLQLNSGGDGLGNSVTISDIIINGGAAVGSPSYYSGLNPGGTATGSLGTSVNISDNSSDAFNEFYQAFTPGSSISFDVTTTMNHTGPVPDEFAVAILDSSLGFPAQIYTTAPDTLSLVTEMITASGALQVAAYQGVSDANGDGNFSSVTAVVPEPAVYGCMAGGVAFVLGMRRKIDFAK